MASTPWYSVGPNDIFPEEFRLFFSGNQRARKVFDKLHSDIYEVSFWQGLQETISSGHVEDFFPYRREMRFDRSPSLLRDRLMATIYLIRHGQASFGAEDYDKLSELGCRQAQVVGEYLAR